MAKRKEKIIPPINAHWEDVIKASVTNIKLKTKKDKNEPSYEFSVGETKKKREGFRLVQPTPENLIKIGFIEKLTQEGKVYERDGLTIYFGRTKGEIYGSPQLPLYKLLIELGERII